MKLTKAETKKHDEAEKILTKPELGEDEKYFVLEHWQPGAIAEEYAIYMIADGRPALRVHGALDRGTPTTARMQWQDSENPWTDYAEADEETLLAFAQQFYFGD